MGASRRSRSPAEAQPAPSPRSRGQPAPPESPSPAWGGGVRRRRVRPESGWMRSLRAAWPNFATPWRSRWNRARGRLPPVGGPREILIVDDDEDTRLVLQDLLELNGYAVRTSPDAHRAIEAVRAAAPALMLIDYFMPDADGAWVVQELRAAGLGRIPVVLITGSNEG